ncbi:MAG: DUF4276 family protein [Candidatus Marinimicrobia bacterium]|nr:DUF4276 family protein [Candidatus Neomarinimicrobiota bacterium]
MAVQIGVIAEARNDIDVLYQLTCKLVAENSFCFRKFIGYGCGKLRRKCNAWAKNLIRRGCTHLVVMHDLDRGDESKLRQELNNAIESLSFDGSLILIPIQEVEAWLLCDASALKEVFSMKKEAKVPAEPERILEPKEHLRDLVWKACGKRYVNTIHNTRIAAEMRIASLKACGSFSPYHEFLEKMTTA